MRNFILQLSLLLYSLVGEAQAANWESFLEQSFIKDDDVSLNFFSPWEKRKRVNFSRDWNGDIYLRTKSCSDIPYYYSQIVTFAQKEKLINTSPEMEMKKIGYAEGCEVNISHLLPKRVKDSLFVLSSYERAPNCWGTTIAMTENSERIRLMNDGRDFTHFLKVACHKIDYDEVGPGDVLVIRNSSKGVFKEESHGAYALSKDLFVTKNGGSEEEAGQIETLEEILRIYFLRSGIFASKIVGENKECFNVKGAIPEKCKVYVEFMRCENYKQKSLNSPSIREEIKTLYRKAAQNELDYFSSEIVSESFNWDENFEEKMPPQFSKEDIIKVIELRKEIYNRIDEERKSKEKIINEERDQLRNSVDTYLKERDKYNLSIEEVDFLTFMLNKF